MSGKAVWRMVTLSGVGFCQFDDAVFSPSFATVVTADHQTQCTLVLQYAGRFLITCEK